MSVKALNVRQERFAELVASGLPATRAYMQAGYNVSEKVAGTNGPRLLENAGVKARIQEILGETARKLEFKRQDLVDHLVAAITTPVGEITEKSAFAQEISYDAQGRKRIKGQSKTESARILIEMLGWKEPEQLVVETGPKTLDAIKERAHSVVSALDARTKAAVVARVAVSAMEITPERAAGRN